MSPKLIETSIPLEAINEASAKEKSIHHRHPSTLHLWWARRPLATARAVLWASLVDDPEDDKKRDDLHKILVKLVQWENISNPDVLNEARKALPENLPELLEPFAGGGTIPLEGQRLGMKVHARDLNPVAVILNKAMIELPAKFAGLPPVNPEARSIVGWDSSGHGASGLAQDIKYYGGRLRDEALSRIGSMYPDVQTEDGPLKVIAWLWARTVKCPNPACGCEMPLVSSWELSRKTGAHAVPHYDGHNLAFTVRTDGKPRKSPKTGRGVFTCSACGASVTNEYLHEEFTAHRDGVRMIAVVAEGKEGGRVYLSPDGEQERAANVQRPEEYPDAEMPDEHHFSPRLYGMPNFADLFTDRQLTMLTTVAGLVPEIAAEAERDAAEAGGRDAKEYAEALGVYLAFVLDKLTAYHSAFCLWHAGRDVISHTFGRQAIPMVWNYAEANPFSNSTGSFKNMLGFVVDAVESLPCGEPGEASQNDAHKLEDIRDVMVSTDPPYYDNIGYADLSDYFYIWMRKVLRKTYPGLFRRMLVPKDEELVAAPHRHSGDKTEARESFEAGMRMFCENLYEYASEDYPSTIYYAYKAGDKDGGNSGWETMLEALIKAGFQITGTWPMRTELVTALKANTNSLASSVVLVCRKRSPDALGSTRAAFVRRLRAELEPALRTMQAGGIAPADLPQSAIGPGMAVYSSYPQIVGTDGKALTVHDALIAINDAVDELLGGFSMDSLSQFCTDLYRMCGWNAMKAGEANNLAAARNISLDGLVNAGVVSAVKGSVQLVKRGELKHVKTVCLWNFAQRLVLARETGGGRKDGIIECANIIAGGEYSQLDKVKQLAYLLYKIADGKRWTDEALRYNLLVTSWNEILAEAERILHPLPEHKTMSLGLEEKE